MKYKVTRSVTVKVTDYIEFNGTAEELERKLEHEKSVAGEISELRLMDKHENVHYSNFDTNIILVQEDGVIDGKVNPNEIKEKFKNASCKLDSFLYYFVQRIPQTRVKIDLPYHTFNVYGIISDAYRDVSGLMPFARKEIRIEAEDATTLFYASEKIHRGNYLPFLADVDVFDVVDCWYEDDLLYIKLKKGTSWRAYL